LDQCGGIIDRFTTAAAPTIAHRRIVSLMENSINKGTLHALRSLHPALIL
jgi:hypothetical protein